MPGGREGWGRERKGEREGGGREVMEKETKIMWIARELEQERNARKHEAARGREEKDSDYRKEAFWHSVT